MIRFNDIIALYKTLNKSNKAHLKKLIDFRKESNLKSTLLEINSAISTRSEKINASDNLEVQILQNITQKKNYKKAIKAYYDLCLEVCVDENTPVAQFTKLMRNRDILHRRYLHKQALEITLRAKKIAKEYFLLFEYAEALDYEIYYTLRFNNGKIKYTNLQKIIDEQRAYTNDLKNYSELYDIQRKATELYATLENKKINSENILKEYSSILQKKYDTNIRVEYRRILTNIFLGNFIGDLHANDYHSNACFELFEDNPKLQITLPLGNISRYSHKIMKLFSGDDFSSFKLLMEEFNTANISPHLLKYKFERIIQLELSFYITLLLRDPLDETKEEEAILRIGEIRTRIDKIDDELLSIKDELTPLHLVNTYANLGIVSLLIEDFKKAIKYFDFIANDFKIGLKEEVVCVTRILNLIASYFDNKDAVSVNDIKKVNDLYRKRFGKLEIIQVLLRVVRCIYNNDLTTTEKREKIEKEILEYERIRESKIEDSIARLFAFHLFFRKLIRDYYV